MTVSLQALTTFALPCHARQIATARTPAQLQALWQTARQSGQPVVILGDGSNVLFVEDFAGTVILNRLTGVQYSQTTDSWLIHAAAGESWHGLVARTLADNKPGLENLALIPGRVGAAPVQNIGAYGVELAQFCHYVDCLDLTCANTVRFSAEECHFSYRESLFKQAAHGRYAIVALGLRLTKHWRAQTHYGELSRLARAGVTPGHIFDEVCRIRRARLPDPAHYGNAGSFFKNPVISAQQAQTLLADYPQMPHYPQANGDIKLAAGWLIDQCQLKGWRTGDAAVHDRQALVIINLGRATSQQVIDLAKHIRQRVADKFAVWLEPEVRFIAAQGEIDALRVLA